MEDWRREIITLCLVKKRLAKVNTGRTPSWPFCYPENPAPEEDLRSFDLTLGSRLDPCYRAFLSHANGWVGFFQRNDLFGTSDLLGGSKNDKARELLASIDNIAEMTGYEKSDLLPIAVSQFEINVFLLTKPSSKTPGKVLWLAGGLIDVYPHFDKFYLAMIDYNRREIQRFDGTLNPGW